MFPFLRSMEYGNVSTEETEKLDESTGMNSPGWNHWNETARRQAWIPPISAFSALHAILTGLITGFVDTFLTTPAPGRGIQNRAGVRHSQHNSIINFGSGAS